MKYYPVTKKNEILPFATIWLDSEGNMLCGISQTEKDKYSVVTYMWKQNNRITNVYNKTETNSDIYRTN